MIMTLLAVTSLQSADIPPPEEDLKMLAEGNKRCVSNAMTRPDRSQARRPELVKGRQPVAIILCCSDSSVPPEIVFE